MVFDEELSEDDLAGDARGHARRRQDPLGRVRAGQARLDARTTCTARPTTGSPTDLRLSKSKITQQLEGLRVDNRLPQRERDPRNIDEVRVLLMSSRARRTSPLGYTDDLAFQQQFKRWLTDGQAQRLEAGSPARDDPRERPRRPRPSTRRAGAAAASVLVREDPALGSDIRTTPSSAATEKLNRAPLDEIHDLSNNKQKLLMLRGLHRAIEDLASPGGRDAR